MEAHKLKRGDLSVEDFKDIVLNNFTYYFNTSRYNLNLIKSFSDNVKEVFIFKKNNTFSFHRFDSFDVIGEIDAKDYNLHLLIKQILCKNTQ